MFKEAVLVLGALAVAAANPAKTFKSLEVFPHTECGASFTSETGEVTSPDYPSNYPDGIYLCEYIITVPEDKTIVIEFDVIATEYNYDYIAVYDGPTIFSLRLAIWTGTVAPTTLSSSGNTVLIRFNSDPTNSDRGFHAKWYTEG